MLHADFYQGLSDAILEDDNMGLADRGHSIILPLSHSGSTHHMYQLLQDSFAICQDYGKPDLFITMTTIAAWPEITENLLQVLWMFILDDRGSCANRYK